MNGSKNALIKSKFLEFIQLLIGSINLLIFGLATLGSIIPPYEEYQVYILLTCLVFDALSIMLIIFGVKRNKLVRRYKQYSSIVGDKASFSISQLSSIAGESEESVLKNLKQMIKWQFIKDAYINEETNSIVFRAVNKVPKPVNTGSSGKEEDSYISVTCKNCGGINKMKMGSIMECEYCSSLIEGVRNGN